jgi:hypothetical protein
MNGISEFTKDALASAMEDMFDDWEFPNKES